MKTGTAIMYFLFLLIVLVSGGCAPTSNELNNAAIAGDQEIRVGVSTNAPPLIYKENNRITGLEADLAKKLETFLSRTVRFVEVPWAKQLEYLNSRKTDIVMSGMTITRQRQYLADFTIPYMQSGQIMLVRMEDSRKFSRGIVDVMNTNYKIGTISGTTGDLFVTETISKPNEISFKTSAQAVNALINKEIDVMVYDAPMVCHYAATNPSGKLIPIMVMSTKEYLAWAVRKDDTSFKADINRFIKTISDNGELKGIINKWIPYING